MPLWVEVLKVLRREGRVPVAAMHPSTFHFLIRNRLVERAESKSTGQVCVKLTAEGRKRADFLSSK